MADRVIVSKKRRFRAELLVTADGVHFGSKEHKRKDTVVLLLWCDNRKEAEDVATKIARALSFSTTLGPIVYEITSVKIHRKSAAI